MITIDILLFRYQVRYASDPYSLNPVINFCSVDPEPLDGLIDRAHGKLTTTGVRFVGPTYVASSRVCKVQTYIIQDVKR